jgi:hypothetical protein
MSMQFNDTNQNKAQITMLGRRTVIVLGSNKPLACIRTTAANEKKTENPTGGARNICVQWLRSLVEDLCRMALFIEKILLINLVAFTGAGCSCILFM